MTQHSIGTSHRIVLLLLIFGLHIKQASAQGCVNADLESGNLTGWTGTWGNQSCSGPVIFGICTGNGDQNPTQTAGFNMGPMDSPTNTNFRHTLHSGGLDPVAGAALPQVHPSGTYSVRLGNATANEDSGGETISYSFTVNSSNVNFTYHYAVVVDAGGGHDDDMQPQFQIRMYDGSNNLIPCATYDVNANSAASIGGFSTVGNIYYKPWSSVFIPLNDYIGQTVRIEFMTGDCRSFEGGHYAYAYIDAECQPLEILSSSPTVCGGQDVQLTAPAGAATYSWTGPSLVPPTDQQIATINQPGAYTVTMTTFGTVPCTFSLDTMMAASPGNPTADFSYSPACQGDPIQFTDLSLPAGQITNWAWDFDNDGTPDNLTQNPTHTFATAGTYPVHLAVAWPPCLADTIIDVTVLAVPTSPFTATSPLCMGIDVSTVTYTGNAPANATYTWDFDGGTVVTGSGQGPYEISWATSGTKTIALEVAVGSCVSSVTTASVVVNPAPVVDGGADVAVCEGLSTTLTASGATTYTWDPPTGLSATTGTSVTATPLTTTTYTITGTASGCTGTGTVTVTVNPYPVTVVDPTTATVCAGTPTTFTASGADTYAWAPATGLSATTGTTVDAAPMTSTTYTVTGTSLGCSSDATFDITVNVSPNLTLSNDATVCEGTPVPLDATGADTYAWSPAAGLDVTTGPSVIATPATTTTYTVVGTGLGCTSTLSVTVTVNPYPVLSVSPATFTMCAGESKDFTASGADSYVWSPATGLSSTTDPMVFADPIVTTTYEVIGTSLGCDDTTSVLLTVNPIPVVTVSNDTTICSGDSAPLAANGATTYVWSPTTDLSPASGAAVIASPMDTVTYSVTGTSLNCSASAVVTVNVNLTPVVTVTPTDAAYCDGDSVTLSASGAATYAWDPTTDLSSSIGASVVANPTASITYTVVGTTSGCTDDASATITVHPNAVVDFAADTTEGCQPFCVTLTNLTTIATGNIGTYVWDLGDGTTIGNHTPIHCYPDTGVYSISLTAISNNLCTSQLTIPDYLTVHPLPTAFFDVEPSTASVLQPRFQFTDLSQGAVQWFWSFGDGTGAGPSTPSPAHVYPTTIDSGAYSVTLLVANPFGCTDTIEHTVYITPNISIYVPNAFTPNSDNHNNRFTAYGENIILFDLRVFNRWGQQIFQTADMSEGWDGSYLGTQVESGQYIYQINYTGFDGNPYTLHGKVMLMR